MSTIAAPSAPSAASTEAASFTPPGKTAEKALSATEMGDRFLKLLVTQLKNQDPLNPMDNAQLTSQMAQINTVSGIEKLNESVKGLGSQFLQAQAVQGAAMIGRQAWVEGEQLVASGGVARGGFELPAGASSVKVEVVGPGERVLDTLDLRAQAAGRGSFQWSLPSGVDPSALSFRVIAKAGTAPVAATPYSIDTVTSVSTGPAGLTVGLARLGDTEFSRVKAVAGG
ncbi:MAG: flagellar hook assembly protein FlgD [Rubrivivax sp.]